MSDTKPFDLADLAAIVSARAADDPDQSYTAKLIGRGIGKCAQKLGEEAVETAIAAVQENREDVKKEAADLLYHLLVVLEASQVPLQTVLEELAARTHQSGLAEKAARAE